MVALQAIFDALNRRKNEALLLAESALPESQFRAFRKLFLNIYGKDGLEGDLQRLYAGDGHKDRNQNGRE